MKKLPKSHPCHWRMLRMRERLMRAYPNCFQPFGEIKKPLKIGIDRDLHDFTTSAYEWRDVLAALRDYTMGKHYYLGVVPGAIRVGLDGEPAGTVGEGAARHAAHCLAKIERREFAAKQAAEIKAKREAEIAEQAKRKAEAEAAAIKAKAAKKHAAPRPAPRRTVQVEIIRRRPGVPGVTRRFG